MTENPAHNQQQAKLQEVSEESTSYLLEFQSSIITSLEAASPESRTTREVDCRLLYEDASITATGYSIGVDMGVPAEVFIAAVDQTGDAILMLQSVEPHDDFYPVTYIFRNPDTIVVKTEESQYKLFTDTNPDVFEQDLEDLKYLQHVCRMTINAVDAHVNSLLNDQ